MLRTLIGCAALTAGIGLCEAAQAQSFFEDRLMIRARAIAVVPLESGEIEAIGGDVEVSNRVVPEVDFTWFFTDNFAVELIAAINPHDVAAVGTAVGDIDLGSVWLLPPTLSLQYHVPFSNGFKPYVGIGANLTVFFNGNLPDDPTSPVTSIDYGVDFGWSVQGGFDWFFNNKNWGINVDFKYLRLDKDVNIGTVIGPIEAAVELNPIIASVGVAYRF